MSGLFCCKRHTGEEVHGDVAPSVSECTAQLPENVFSQILRNFFPWLSPRVSYSIYCTEWHKLFVYSETITGDEPLSAVDQEQVPYIAESCYVVCFQSNGSGPLVIKVQDTSNIFKSSNSHVGLIHGIM